MKILSMIDAISGGGGMVMYNLIKGLPQHEHLVVCPGTAPSWSIGLPRLIRDAKIPVYLVCADARHQRGMMNAMEQKVMEFDPDIIINHWWRSSKIQRLNKFGKTRKVYGRAKTILVSHNNDPSPPGYDYYVSVSKYNSRFQVHTNKERKGRPSNHRVIYNGIDINQFGVRRQQVDRGKFVIGRVSSLAKFKIAKDWINFVNSFNIKNMLHIIVGNGHRYIQLRRDIEALKVQDRFLLAGEVPNHGTMLPKMLSRFDIILYMTEKTEAFSLAMLEAMAAGLPIITDNRGGMPEQIVHGKTGFLVNSRQEARQYCELLARKPELVKQMGMAAKERAKQFTIPKMCAEYDKLFKELVG